MSCACTHPGAIACARHNRLPGVLACPCDCHYPKEDADAAMGLRLSPLDEPQADRGSAAALPLADTGPAAGRTAPVAAAHAAALRAIEALMELDPPANTPEGALLHGLAIAVEDFERAT